MSDNNMKTDVQELEQLQPKSPDGSGIAEVIADETGAIEDELFDADAVQAGGVLHTKSQSSWVAKTFSNIKAVVGLVGVILVVLFGLLGPFFAPHTPTEVVGLPYAAPSSACPLGTDILGRDVFSMLLSGGRLYLFEGFLAAFIGVGVGAIIGMIMGLSPRKARKALLFCNDTIMVVPQILVVLVIIAAFQASPVTLIVAVSIAQIPYSARVVQAATRRIVNEDYYIAARMAGQSRAGLMVNQILPNIAGPLLVEFGVRLCIVFVALASLSYLGFGAGGDWGQMIHENQGGISIQPFAVMAPIVCIAIFLISMNLLRDSASRSIGGK